MLVTVLLEGFHAVKHALRFGADVHPLITTDLAAAISLAETHAPDLRERFAAATEVDQNHFKLRVGRTHPTGVAGFAEKPEPAFDRAAPIEQEPAFCRKIGVAHIVLRPCRGGNA